MERLRGITIILLLTVAVFACAAAGKAASTLLQEGLYAEEVDGDLDAAIKLYQQVIDQSAAQRSHVAQAMYRQGMCYLKKQDEPRAREVFAELVADYGDQTRVVEKVRPMLEELSNGDPAALMPPDTLIYLEGGSPGKQFETILKMLKGTPFENPLAAIGGGKGDSQLGPQNILAGLLNPSMMAEFKKIRGIGVGVTGVAENDPPIIIVLYPGKSDALRGLLMAALSMIGTPGETIEGMQTVAIRDGGGVAYDDTVVIFASPNAYKAGQLTWCAKQHKGLTSDPTLASSNKSFAKVSRKDRQDNALTVWAKVDEVFAGLKGVLPAGEMPEQIQMANQFVDFANVNDFITFLSIKEDRIAVETNVSFKDGHQSVAYNLMRTSNLSKAAFNAVPSEAVVLISVASPEPGSPQSQMLSGKLKEKMGLEIGDDVFSNIDQITLFALPPAAGEALPGMPAVATSFGVVMTSDQPQQTRQILTGLLTSAKLIASQSSNEQNDGKYLIELVNELRLHGYVNQAGKAMVLSLNPAVIDASVAAISNRKSVAAAGPLSEAVRTMSAETSKLALINVGGMLGFVEADEEVSELVAKLASSCDKTTVRFRTQEGQNNLNVRAEVSGLPPVGQVIEPAMQLAKLIQQAKAHSRKQARMTGIPGVIRHTSRRPAIDGKAEDLWSEIRKHNISNTAYAPPSDRSDLTAFYRAMWDDDNLYVLVDVMDDVLKNDSDEFYLDDCVEVFIDADNSKSADYGDNDYQYFFEWAEANPQMGESRHGKTDGVQFAVGRADVGYRVEIRFPWSTLGTNASLGAKIGLDVHVNDDDDGGDRDTKLMWRGKEDNAWQTPQAFGTAQLAGLVVGWWKLDETEGENAGDSSGNNHTGTLIGNPQWRPSGGKIGGALEFDGVDDYVETDYAADLSSWTVAAWVKGSAAPSPEWPSGPVHREKNYQINWNHGTDAFRGAAGTQVGGTWYAASFGDLQGGKWYYLVATYDGESLKAYRDGVLITNNSDPSGLPEAESETLKLGRHPLTADYFSGTVDDVRIYNYALGEGEIELIYNEGK